MYYILLKTEPVRINGQPIKSYYNLFKNDNKELAGSEFLGCGRTIYGLVLDLFRNDRYLDLLWHNTSSISDRIPQEQGALVPVPKKKIEKFVSEHVIELKGREDKMDKEIFKSSILNSLPI